MSCLLWQCGKTIDLKASRLEMLAYTIELWSYPNGVIVLVVITCQACVLDIQHNNAVVVVVFLCVIEDN